MYKIYKYTNVHNKKVYIGQTSRTLKERAQSNGSNYRECPKFYNAIKKYGWNSFIPEILEDGLTVEEANQAEIKYIKQYRSLDDKYGYNICVGGNNSPLSENAKRIISQKAKERLKNPENNPMYGRKHSDNALEKMSSVKRGKLNPMYGKKLTAEHKEKIRKNCKGWVYEWTPERRHKAAVRSRINAEKWTKQVLCIEDNIMFDSITTASKYYHVSKSTLSGHINGHQKSCANRHFKIIDNEV